MYFEYFTFLFQKLVSLWLYWIFTAVCRLSLVAMHEGLLSNCGAWTSHCSCFFCCGARALGRVGSVVVWLPGLVASRQVESSRKRDETCVPCSGRQIPNHWTTREVQNISLSWSNTLQWLLLQNWAKIPNRQVGVRGGKASFVSLVMGQRFSFCHSYLIFRINIWSRSFHFTVEWTELPVSGPINYRKEWV